MKASDEHLRLFKQGDVFEVAAGEIYRIERVVTVNGVELVIYQTIHEIKDRRYKVANHESAAVPRTVFAKMLTAQHAVSIADPLG